MSKEQINKAEELELPNQDAPDQDDKKKKSAMPAFIVSAFVHSILILITFLIVVSISKPKQDDVIVTSELTEVPEEIIDPEVKREVVKNNVEVVVSTEIEVQPMVTNQETTDHNETDNNMDVGTSEGTAEGISDSPQVGSGMMGNIGGGGGGGGTFGTRSGGGKKKALLKGGGSAKTESSVDAALRWLMRHQEKDGHWDKNKYGNDNDNSGFARNQTEGSCALTGLATLAFLSAGHTPRIGKYKNTVKNAIDWLVENQKPDGSWGNAAAYSGYDNSICTLVLAECVGMYPETKIKVAAQKALDFLATYNETQKFHKVINGKPNSISLGGWMMMAFKSAKIAGLKIPEEVFKRFKERIDEMSDKDQSGNPGIVSYINKGDRNASNTTMTAVGMLMYEYLGVNRTELQTMADIIIKDLPSWGANSMNNDLYKWYYATLAMFQFGGEHWKKWNSVMSKMLVDNQRKGGPLDGSLQDIDGSWDFEGDFWGKNLGRIYSTAMAAFCLEVYYRYESVVH